MSVIIGKINNKNERTNADPVYERIAKCFRRKGFCPASEIENPLRRSPSNYSYILIKLAGGGKNAVWNVNDDGSMGINWSRILYLESKEILILHMFVSKTCSLQLQDFLIKHYVWLDKCSLEIFIPSAATKKFIILYFYVSSTINRQ